MYIDDENKLIWDLNKLYWFKDSFKDKETQVDYLRYLKQVADNLQYEGLVKDIKSYLLTTS
jgi:hypothetical protein